MIIHGLFWTDLYELCRIAKTVPYQSTGYVPEVGMYVL